MYERSGSQNPHMFNLEPKPFFDHCVSWGLLDSGGMWAAMGSPTTLVSFDLLRVSVRSSCHRTWKGEGRRVGLE